MSHTVDMLILKDDLLICCGGMRRCYRHPDDETRCVKVYRSLDEIPSSAVAKRFRIIVGSRIRRFNINVQEYDFWRSLIDDSEISHRIGAFLPQMDGLVDSNHGIALVEELLLDEGGGPARNLWQLKDELSVEQLRLIRADLRSLADCVIEFALPIYDWNPQNVLIVRADGQCKLKLPDLEGEMSNKELIKISRWSKTFRRNKLKRRVHRFFIAFDRDLLPPE